TNSVGVLDAPLYRGKSSFQARNSGVGRTDATVTPWARRDGEKEDDQEGPPLQTGRHRGTEPSVAAAAAGRRRGPPPPREVDENHRSGIATRPPAPRDVDDAPRGVGRRRHRGRGCAVGRRRGAPPTPPRDVHEGRRRGCRTGGDAADRDTVQLTVLTSTPIL
ncbi:hypothetical protein THAOC_24085, partial [Thalassiosira oceanica]